MDQGTWLSESKSLRSIQTKAHKNYRHMVVIGIESVQSWDFAVIKKKRHESQEGFFLPQVTEN